MTHNDIIHFTVSGDGTHDNQNDVCRVRLDVSVLDEIVHEYCIYRGVVDSVPIISGEGLVDTSRRAVDQLDQGRILSPNCSVGNGNAESVSSCQVEDSQSKINLVGDQHTDMELRSPCETPSLSEDCSTSRMSQPKDSKVVLRNRSALAMERGKRKRWRGRSEDLEIDSEVIIGRSSEGQLQP